MTDFSEERIAELIAALPPAPRRWVQAARRQPAQRDAFPYRLGVRDGEQRAMSQGVSTPEVDRITASLTAALRVLRGDQAEAETPVLTGFVADDRVRRAADEVHEALVLLREDEATPGPAGRGGRLVHPDRCIRQSAERVESGLALLLSFEEGANPGAAGAREEAEVQAHALAYHAQARQVIGHVEHALALLRGLQAGA